jgi:hypothetical protein
VYESVCLPQRQALARYRAMAGQPLRRQHLGKPSQASVARAGLSAAAWCALSPAEKLETLFGCSLDRDFDFLSWPADGLNPVQLAAQTTWGGAVMMLAGKFDIEAARERQRRRRPTSLREGSAAAVDPTTPHQRHRPRAGKIRTRESRDIMEVSRADKSFSRMPRTHRNLDGLEARRAVTQSRKVAASSSRPCQ